MIFTIFSIEHKIVLKILIPFCLNLFQTLHCLS